jgi:hypothetical protein
MPRHQLEHVVQKTYPGMYSRPASPVEIERQANIRLRGRAVKIRAARALLARDTTLEPRAALAHSHDSISRAL